MLLALGLLSAVVAVLVAFPDTEIGLGLNRWLVEAPARALNRVRPGKAAFYAFLAAFGFTLVLLFEADGLRLFGFMLPDTPVWFAVFDVGVFVDALLITGAILATNGQRAVRAHAAAVPEQISANMRRGAARARRVLKPPSRPTGKISDDEGPRWGQPPYRAFNMA